MTFKPMLADEVNLNLLKYPVVVSPKMDGVRATFQNGKLVTRSLKPLPNKSIDPMFQSFAPLDGELIVGDPRSSSVFRDTMKIVSSFEGDIKELKFHVFDVVYEGSFKSRLYAALAAIEGNDLFVPVPHVGILNEHDLLNYEETVVSEGFEGVMIRDPQGKYKFGRSTAREGGLLKLKRRLQSEAVVMGFVEQMHNANEFKQDALGYAERSSHQENMVPANCLGALTVRDVKSHVEFNVGTGFLMEDRIEIWKNKEKYGGRTLTYEYLPVGVKDKPRHPVFIGWRMMEDV